MNKHSLSDKSQLLYHSSYVDYRSCLISLNTLLLLLLLLFYRAWLVLVTAQEVRNTISATRWHCNVLYAFPPLRKVPVWIWVNNLYAFYYKCNFTSDSWPHRYLCCVNVHLNILYCKKEKSDESVSINNSVFCAPDCWDGLQSPVFKGFMIIIIIKKNPRYEGDVHFQQ